MNKAPKMVTLWWPDGTMQVHCDTCLWVGPNRDNEADLRADAADHDCETEAARIKEPQQ